MWLIAHGRSVFLLVVVSLHLLTNSYPLPIHDPLGSQPRDSVYNQLINGQDLVIHENSGAVFSRIGYYYEVDDIFGLTVTLPVTQYLCSVLPMEQIEKLSLCLDYRESLLRRTNDSNIFSHSSISDFLNSTNNTRFPAEKVSFNAHHRAKRLIPLIIGVTASAMGLLFVGGLTVYSSAKMAFLNSRVSEIQTALTETNHQLTSLEVSVLTNTNTTLQLARSFSKAQENVEIMRGNMQTLGSHVSRLDTFAGAQTRFNLRTHAERVYDRLKNSIRRIERNDLNLDFLDMTEQNELLEIAFSHLEHSVPTTSESKTAFVSRMLFAQTVQFFSSDKAQRTSDASSYFPQHLGNIIFTSYFSVLKTNTADRMQIYKLTALPFFTPERETATKLFGLPEIVGISIGGYLEWKEASEKSQCDFGDYTVCRDPPVLQKRINNMCLEQLISTSRHFHRRVRHSLYTSPHFQKIRKDVLALSTRLPLNCTTSRGDQVFKNVSIVQMGCKDRLICANSIHLMADKRCTNLKPYVMKTAQDEIIPVIEPIRSLNISLPTVYPFAADKNLLLTLEEQMKTQEKNLKETEKTGKNLSQANSLGLTSPWVIPLTIALIIFVLLVIVSLTFFFCRCSSKLPICPQFTMTTGITVKQPSNTSTQPTRDDLNSLEDLFTAFAQNQSEKKKTMC
jgi:hypothetical protein